MEYEIEEEDLLFDHWSSNPSLHQPGEKPGTRKKPNAHRREFEIPEEHQMA